MVEIDGREYVEQTPTENAYDLIMAINDYCVANDVRNSKGSIVSIDINPTNPLYLLVFGFAYLVSILQKLLISAANSYNVARSSDAQLLNISELTRIRRIQPAKMVMNVIVTCDGSQSEPCVIDETLSVTYTAGTYTVIMHPAFGLSIEPGASKLIVLIAEDYTSLNIPANTITSFDTNPDHLSQMYNYASINGHPIESIANLRSRIQAEQSGTSRISRTITDILNLTGIVQCNIYYNYKFDTSSTVRGITVPPRQALVFVQGWNANIADTFYSHLACLTAGSDVPEAIQQDYVSRTGQVVPLYIIPPTEVPMEVQILIKANIGDDYWMNVQQQLSMYTTSYVIGQEIFAVDIISYLMQNFPDLGLVDVQIFRVSDRPVTETGVRIFTQPYELMTLNTTNIIKGIANNA